jgi:hypothetical protein
VQAQIVGRVVDETRRPVEGVEVIVGRREVRARTDRAGLFRLHVSSKDSTVGFRRIGYRSMLLTIHPLPPFRDTILVQLVKSPIELPEVIVSGSPSKSLRYAWTTKYDEVFLRGKISRGTLITREDIDRRLGVQTYELLQGIPGVRTWNGPPKRIRFARCQELGGVSVFIDGIRQISRSSRSGFAAATVSPGRGEGRIPQAGATADPGVSSGLAEDEPEIEMLSRVNPWDIGMIEVYRGLARSPGYSIGTVVP